MSSNSNVFEVRLKNNDKIFSRHYEARDGKRAALRAEGKGKILWVRKVHPSDIIGTIGSMNLQGIIGVERRQEDVILSNATLDSLIFPGKKKGRKKNNGRFRNETE